MRFAVDHDFPAEPRAVIDVLCDPEFQRQLELPDLSLPAILEASTTETVRVLKLRYEFVGHLDPIARKLLGNRELVWAQELRIDMSSNRGSLSFAAQADPNRMHGRGDITLTSTTTGAHRHIDGELLVRVPLVGGTAEKKIVPGLIRRLDIEAAAVAQKLRG
jgi:hypothetical protein